jgi:hypothetical protein
MPTFPYPRKNEFLNSFEEQTRVFKMRYAVGNEYAG